VVLRRTIKNKENPRNQENLSTKPKPLFIAYPMYEINSNHNKTRESFAKYGEPGTTKLYK
jgi:hypothetical protein